MVNVKLFKYIYFLLRLFSRLFGVGHHGPHFPFDPISCIFFTHLCHLHLKYFYFILKYNSIILIYTAFLKYTFLGENTPKYTLELYICKILYYHFFNFNKTYKNIFLL